MDTPAIYKAIEDNDLQKVLFSEPFSESTKKFRTGLVLSSVLTLLIVILNLKVSGFLGLKANTDAIESELVKGIGCLFTLYYFIQFSCHSLIDLMAWKFKKERCLISGHQELVCSIERQLRLSIEHINYSVYELKNLSLEPEMQAQIHNQEILSVCQQYMNQTLTEVKTFKNEIREFIDEWNKRIASTSLLNFRFLFRLISLSLIEIGLPVFFALLTFYKSFSGIVAVYAAIA